MISISIKATGQILLFVFIAGLVPGFSGIEKLNNTEAWKSGDLYYGVTAGHIQQSVKAQAHVHTVTISDMKFQPPLLTVNKGDTVIWKNEDIVVHCVTQLPAKSWTSSLIPPGKSWKKVMTETSDYDCAIHQVMKGKIIVK